MNSILMELKQHLYILIDNTLSVIVSNFKAAI